MAGLLFLLGLLHAGEIQIDRTCGTELYGSWLGFLAEFACNLFVCANEKYEDIERVADSAPKETLDDQAHSPYSLQDGFDEKGDKDDEENDSD